MKLNNFLLYLKVCLSQSWDSFKHCQYIAVYKKFETLPFVRFEILFPEVYSYDKYVHKIFLCDDPLKKGISLPTILAFYF